MKRPAEFAKVKRAELLSTTGALVLGSGFGLLLARAIAAYALPIPVLGAFSHLIGMYCKRGMETVEAGAEPFWYRLLYWGCWLAVIALLLGALVWLMAQGAAIT